jgi:hypothetical protein
MYFQINSGYKVLVYITFALGYMSLAHLDGHAECANDQLMMIEMPIPEMK